MNLIDFGDIIRNLKKFEVFYDFFNNLRTSRKFSDSIKPTTLADSISLPFDHRTTEQEDRRFSNFLGIQNVLP